MDRITPRIGDTAPDFTLTADDGTTVTLSNFRGRDVVIYFYPKAGTSGCTAQACAFRDAMPELFDAGAVVMGVSPDGLPALVKFKTRDGLNYPLLSDPDHAVADLYGAWGAKSMYGKAYDGIIRSQYVIDPDGVIAAASPKIAPAGSVPAALKAIRGERQR